MERTNSLAALRREAADCRACPLWRPATQTVFGEGPRHALAVLVGEQPGNREDRLGRPFVGPAGQLLNEVMQEAGIDRKAVYLTNTVKHFKFEPRGKVRLHKRASMSEQAACRHWLEAELGLLQPPLVVALGAMAAQALFGQNFRLTASRGQWQAFPDGRLGLATWHPSAALRAPAQHRRTIREELTADLGQLAFLIGMFPQT